MAPARLAIIASTVLADLWFEEDVRPDVIEATTWMPVDEILRFRELVSGQPLFLHGGNLLGAPLRTAQEQELLRQVQATGAPYVSAHISLWPWKVLQEARQRGRQPSALDLGRHLDEFFARVRSLREHLGIPLVLENAPGLPGVDKDPESDPEMIAAVLEATGCSFLLDLSYAQTAARNWGCAPAHYLQRLPLHRVVEVHLSAPVRLEDGRLVDAHEPLREEDYDLLRWLLARATPQLVTLEYWKEPRALLEQVLRLKEQLAGD